MHLDVEGGVSERRTTPSSNTLDVATSSTIQDAGEPKARFANVEVEIEEKAEEETPVTAISVATGVEKMGISPEGSTLSQGKSKKAKKKVGFRSDRPDLYDF
ncbi:hypothetical protein MPER_00674 [Moniliophthora perniciosa FA553]|nr:hypothetical protein MPER_00674 [Moniliophthora perniciosa FA553]